VNLLKKEKIEDESEPIKKGKTGNEKTKWDEEDSFRLIEAVTLYGKNWGKVISILQNEQHRFVTLNANEPGDRTKLRTHYNNQKKKFLQKEFKRKKPSKKFDEKQLESFNENENLREKRFIDMKIALENIENGELLSNTNSTTEDEEIRMEESKDEVKNIKETRKKVAENVINEELKFKRVVIESIQANQDLIKHSNQLFENFISQLIGLLKEQNKS